MASLTETLCCLTHIPACNAVGVVSPSLLELQLLPARQNLGFTFVLLASVLRPQKFLDHETQIKNEDILDNQDTTGALLQTQECAFCITCAADSGANSLRQKGAVVLPDGLRAANQV